MRSKIALGLIMMVAVLVTLALLRADRGGIGNLAGRWDVIYVSTADGIGLPAKVGDTLRVDPDGYFASISNFENKIGIAGRSICGFYCYTIYNLWTGRTYRATVASQGQLVLIEGPAEFQLLGKRRIQVSVK